MLAALTPGWMIPRILGTLAFLAAPTWTGLVALISWWLVVQVLWIVAARLLKRWRRSKELRGDDWR